MSFSKWAFYLVTHIVPFVATSYAIIASLVCGIFVVIDGTSTNGDCEQPSLRIDQVGIAYACGWMDPHNSSFPLLNNSANNFTSTISSEVRVGFQKLLVDEVSLGCVLLVFSAIGAFIHLKWQLHHQRKIFNACILRDNRYLTNRIGSKTDSMYITHLLFHFIPCTLALAALVLKLYNKPGLMCYECACGVSLCDKNGVGDVQFNPPVYFSNALFACIFCSLAIMGRRVWEGFNADLSVTYCVGASLFFPLLFFCVCALPFVGTIVFNAAGQPALAHALMLSSFWAGIALFIVLIGVLLWVFILVFVCHIIDDDD
eukprot:m.150202 g.150202  ORF g.150202 m.150202 type:complete len:315 (-) comp13280_c0_seq14:1568-2512(-)